MFWSGQKKVPKVRKNGIFDKSEKMETQFGSYGYKHGGLVTIMEFQATMLFILEGLAVGVGFGAVGTTSAASFESAR